MRRLMLVVGAVAVAVVALSAVGWASAGITAPPPEVVYETFLEHDGDVPGGTPDIIDLLVSRDSNGLIGVQTYMNRFEATSTVTLFLDTDRSAATGSPGGFDYAVWALIVPGRKVFGFRAWSGDRWADAEAATLGARISWGGTVARFLVEINASDLGGVTSGFAFRLETEKLDASGAFVRYDEAPDVGAWTFDAMPATPSAPVAVPVIGGATTRPARPIAGRRFTATFSVTWSGSREPVTAVVLVAEPSIAGNGLAHEQSFVGGKARLSLSVPRSTRGQRLEIKVKILVGGTSAAKVVAYRIR